MWGRRSDGKPISYLMSLLVVRAYETARSDDPHRYIIMYMPHFAHALTIEQKKLKLVFTVLLMH